MRWRDLGWLLLGAFIIALMVVTILGPFVI